MIFGRIVCLFKGHKRGKLIGEQSAKRTHEDPLGQRTLRIFGCPRCGNRTMYTAKPASSQNQGTAGDQA